jgi:hypothetical protein
MSMAASGYPDILGPLDPILGGENGVFLASWAWKFSMLLFMLFRAALPFVMAKNDKALLSKISIIIRYSHRTYNRARVVQLGTNVNFQMKMLFNTEEVLT